MASTQESKYEKAWRLLGDKGLKLGEKMFIRSAFCSVHKDEYPFIIEDFTDIDLRFKSEIEAIKHLSFGSKEHVILANAVYENTKEDFNINKFVSDLEYINKIIS